MEGLTQKEVIEKKINHETVPGAHEAADKAINENIKDSSLDAIKKEEKEEKISWLKSKINSMFKKDSKEATTGNKTYTNAEIEEDLRSWSMRKSQDSEIGSLFSSKTSAENLAKKYLNEEGIELGKEIDSKSKKYQNMENSKERVELSKELIEKRARFSKMIQAKASPERMAA